MGICFSIVKFSYILKIFHKENLKTRKLMLQTIETQPSESLRVLFIL